MAKSSELELFKEREEKMRLIVELHGGASASVAEFDLIGIDTETEEIYDFEYGSARKLKKEVLFEEGDCDVKKISMQYRSITKDDIKVSLEDITEENMFKIKSVMETADDIKDNRFVNIYILSQNGVVKVYDEKALNNLDVYLQAVVELIKTIAVYDRD